MAFPYIIFDATTGAILKHGVTSRAPHLEDGEDVILGVVADQTRQIVDVARRILVTREGMSVTTSRAYVEAGGDDVFVIDGVPAGTNVTVRQGSKILSGVTEDGLVEVTAEEEGKIMVILEHPRYLREKVVIDAI